MTKAVLLEDPHPSADPIFADADITVERISGALDESELIDALSDADIVGIRSKTSVTRRVIEACPRLSVIGCFCIGTNQVDIDAATAAGIAIFNAPYSNTRSVVELAIGHIISLTRRIPAKNAALHRGEWQKTASGAHEVRGKTLGIVGYGNIGTQLSVLAEAMGMNVVFYDHTDRLALGNAVKLGSLDDLLRMSDVVSLHVDGRETNRDFFGEREFSQMKDGALFINLARGFVADIEALRRHLVSGHLAGAAVDVYPSEPKKNGDPFTSPLVGLDNVILTPHIGGSTLEAQNDIGRFVAGKIVDYRTRGITEMSVNIPNLTLQANPDARYRLCHIHRNMPGVLAAVNQTFATQGVNINGQILGTQAEVGYALTDIASELPVETVAALRAMTETVRLRVLELDSANA
ncbi:phosphoglycerate dehydrogenase [Nanchangia anserum]|uniref:Phosphoglycerate dehydrogenase n=1 Tax=Nanchangia anserum TaxID=2692125 RepID=A0A8I0GG88_9ACTO|nr:phosphoglycerate dehydrogenase [Nanchangia anserum]MBD3690252.1 phosphoglycerate dehydrogenase [Nanchangia anserum]